MLRYVCMWIYEAKNVSKYIEGTAKEILKILRDYLFPMD